MPAGLKRSRALWDNACRPHTSRLQQVMAYMRALLYEVQPLRYSQVKLTVLQWNVPARQALKFLHTCLTTYGPQLVKWLWQTLSQLTLRQWMYGGFALVYYYALKWIHATLEAGPLVLLSTALVLIWTVGLSDNANDHDGLSAYSVFNRGFQKLLGSVNEHDLLMQHVGGGGMNFMMGMGNHDNHANQRHNNDDDDDDDDDWRPHNRRQDNNNPPARDQQQQPEQQPNENPPPPQQQRARRSGKKARCRNLEQRQEVRRQRQAAAERGLVEGGAEEAAAMQALLEEQIAENEARNVDEQQLFENNDDDANDE